MMIMKRTNNNNSFTVFIVIFTLGNFLFKSMSTSELHRIAFQNYYINDNIGEHVKCYGTCKGTEWNSAATRKKRKSIEDTHGVDISNCNGDKVKISCLQGLYIKIVEAKIGALSPDLSICTYKKPLDCLRNISDKIQTICIKDTTCSIDVENVKTPCRGRKHVAMDIRYKCVDKPVIQIPTTLIGTTSLTRLSTARRSFTTSTKSRRRTSSAKMTSQQIHIFNKNDTATTQNMFWTVTAFTALKDGEFMKRHETHLALALLLSMFLGTIICLCFFIDYYRRSKKNRKKKKIETKLNLLKTTSQNNDVTDVGEKKHNKIIEQTSFINESTQKSKERRKERTRVNNNNKDKNDSNGEIGSPYSTRRKLLRHNNLKTATNERPLSDISLPPPPCEFLVKESTSSLSSNELLPPPDGFNGNKKHIPSLIVTDTSTKISPSLTVNKSPTPNLNDVIIDKIDEAISNDDENIYVDNSDEFYHECGESIRPYLHSQHINKRYILPPTKVKFASTNQNNRRHHHNMPDRFLSLRSLERNGVRKYYSSCNSECCPSENSMIQKCNSYDDNRHIFMTNNYHHNRRRHPRHRGQIHILQRCEETRPLRNFSRSGICSDNEAARRKKHCASDMNKHSGCISSNSHRDRTSLSNMYCTGCGQPDVVDLNCSSSLTSNCQSSHCDEEYQDRRQSGSRTRYHIEESGYHSHDTGTDSLCSSAFSTDQEDSRISSPISLSSNLNNRLHTTDTSCHTLPKLSKRAPTFSMAIDPNKTQVTTARSRRDDYTNIDVHRHHNHTSIDVHPYDSSMDDASSRDSVRIIQQMHVNDMLEEDVVDTINDFDENGFPLDCIPPPIEIQELVNNEAVHTG